MQHENSADPWGFWADEPTRSLKRTQVGVRVHGETRMVPVVRMDRTRHIPEPHPRNPLVMRVLAMVGAMLLLVPVAMALRHGNRQVNAAAPRAVQPIEIGTIPPAPTDATVAPETAAPTTLAATTAAPTTPAPTEAVIVTAAATVAPTDPPTTAAKKKTAPKATTSSAPPSSAAQPAAVVCAITYTIVRGDAWSSIASRAKVSMSSLLAANNATTSTVLIPGRNICLPAGATAPGPPATSAPTTTQPKPRPPATTQPPAPPASTAPPSTQPAPPANTYTKAQVAQIIRDVWPDDLEDQAIAIATRESNLIPTVRNACCYGLFQIYYTAHKTWLASIGVTSAAQLYDPRVNASAALALYNISGWAPWATSTPTTTVAVQP